MHQIILKSLRYEDIFEKRIQFEATFFKPFPQNAVTKAYDERKFEGAVQWNDQRFIMGWTQDPAKLECVAEG